MTNQRSLFNAAAVGMIWMLIVIANGVQARGQNFKSGNAKQNRSPYQQRLSPYLDLLRNDSSTLSPYHSFVQPRQQVQKNLSRQSLQLQRLKQSFDSGPTLMPTQGRMQTGGGGTFENYLHFYQTPASRSSYGQTRTR